jgi:cytochrome P450
MQERYSAAKAERRSPTAQEIISARVPYLDAVLEEILRCGGTIQTVDREAMTDTVVLGHKIPKGTLVIMPTGGASVRSPAFDIDEGRRHGSSQEAKKSGRSRHEWDPMDIGAFKPERWLTDDSGEFDAASGPQLAFSLGTRSCFGKRLAYIQFRMLVVLIVWHFELLKCSDELSSYGHKISLTTEPTHCFVKLRKVQL